MRIFFDTNILVYLFDHDSPDKKAKAQKILSETGAESQPVVSTQVLQEFYVTVTRKLAMPLEPEIAEQALRNLTELPVIKIDPAMMLSAVAKSQRYGFSFWDSLIITAAISSGAKLLFSEDLQHDQIIDGLRIINPFS
jgi:predicted nucleic acid-binding protein